MSVFALTGPAWAADLQEITYALPSKSLLGSPARIAEEMGLFAKRGLKPTFSYVDSTSGTATALLSGSVDFGTTGTNEPIAAAARGQHLLIVANHYKGLAGALILSKAAVTKLGVKPDAPLADRLKAVNGLVIASTSKVSSFTVSYEGAIRSVGAEPRFTYMAVGAMEAALEQGAVDGAVLTAPLWTTPVLRGVGVLWLSPAKGDLDYKFMPSAASVTTTTPAYAAAHPDVVRKVADVYDELAADFKDHPDLVKAAIVKLFPEIPSQAWDMVLTLEAQSFETKPLTPADIAHDIAYMKMSGMDLGPIDKVDPASVLYQR
jgi:ABC-type nitrate/sulfonate/bicarbonate transport system substrate-binding protein